MNPHDKLRQLAEIWNDAWNSRDPARLAALLAPGGTYYEPELDSGPVDAEGLAAIASKTWAEWPEATFTARSLTVDPPRLVLEWHSSATHRSGTVVRLEGVDVLEWAGDKIVSARVYYDVHTRRQQLSATPAI